MVQAWLSSFIAVLWALSAQGASSSTALLEGTVLNKLTNAPVKSAHVIYVMTSSSAAADSQPLSADTDADGHFAIPVLAGSYRVWAERPGYARQALGSRTPAGPGMPITLEPGQHKRDLEIRMTPLGAIAGRVFDDYGEPLQGVGIQVLRFSYATGARLLIAVSGASSDDRGAFRAYNLPAGRYLLLATPRGEPLTHRMEGGSLVPQAQELFAPLYYPGVLDPASASEIAVGEGTEIDGIDFHMSKVRAVAVRGRLLSPLENLSESEIHLVLTHRDGNMASYIDRASGAFDKASGRFEFPSVAPGSYWLVASQLYQGHAFAARLPIEISASSPPENLTVMLTPSFDVEGRVIVEQEAALLNKLVIRLAAPDGLGVGPPPRSKVAPDGSFRLTGVTVGVWSVSVDSMPGDLWIKSESYGESDALQGSFSIVSSPAAPLRIVLAGRGGELAGSVSGSLDGGHVSVVLAPAAPELQKNLARYQVVSLQKSGAYAFKAIPPGTYNLYAIENAEPFVWVDVDAMKAISSMGETVSVAEGEHLSRDLVVIPAEALVPSR